MHFYLCLNGTLTEDMPSRQEIVERYTEAYENETPYVEPDIEAAASPIGADE